MSFKLEVKDSILVFRFGGEEFIADDCKQLNALLIKQTPQACFVHLKSAEVIEAPDALEEIQIEWFEKGFPMVFIAREAHHFLFSEDCAIVGSHQEGLDWLEENQD